VFWLCERSQTDRSVSARYPRLPVIRCRGQRACRFHLHERHGRSGFEVEHAQYDSCRDSSRDLASVVHRAAKSESALGSSAERCGEVERLLPGEVALDPHDGAWLVDDQGVGGQPRVSGRGLPVPSSKKKT
jgi:hypothetical protein